MPSENTNIINMVGTVLDPTTVSQPVNGNNSFAMGPQTDTLVSEIHGQFWTANKRNKVFQASVSAVTFPLVTATATSVFSLYNPPGSGVEAELLYTTLTQQLATGVVNTIGWYFSMPSVASTTFTTKGTVNSGKLGASTGNQVQFWTALTYTAIPTLGDVVGGFGATTNTTSTFPFKNHNGTLSLPPGILISLMMSTAAGTTTGWGAETKWIEWPV